MSHCGINIITRNLFIIIEKNMNNPIDWLYKNNFRQFLRKKLSNYKKKKKLKETYEEIKGRLLSRSLIYHNGQKRPSLPIFINDFLLLITVIFLCNIGSILLTLSVAGCTCSDFIFIEKTCLLHLAKWYSDFPKTENIIENNEVETKLA